MKGITNTTYIHLVRHGETEWNVQHRMQGQADSQLSPKGFQQALELSEALQEIDFNAIYCSSSGRAVTTAQILQGKRQLPLFKDDSLKEIHLGRWEGLTKEEAWKRYPEEFPPFWDAPDQYRPGEGESFHQVQDRTVARIKALRDKHIGEHILIVTHTVVLKVVLAYFEPRPISKIWEPPYIYPASHSLLALSPDMSRVLSYAGVSYN